jgi:hypothetical protein
MKRLTNVLLALAIVVRSGDLVLAVPGTGRDIPGVQSPDWVVDKAQLLVSAQAAYDGSMGMITRVKRRGVFDESLRGLSYEELQVVLNVAWYVIAIGEHAPLEASFEDLLKKISAEMGDILIPPWICSPDAYKENIDALALKNKTLSYPFPEPKFRTLSEVVDEARERMRGRIQGHGSEKR